MPQRNLGKGTAKVVLIGRFGATGLTEASDKVLAVAEMAARRRRRRRT